MSAIPSPVGIFISRPVADAFWNSSEPRTTWLSWSNQGLLFVRQAHGITNDVDKENMRDLQAQLRFRFLRHEI
jgi:hypothetical protein